jgi:hypothetical protein
MAALMEILQRKEAKLQEIKTRFQDFKKLDRAKVHATFLHDSQFHVGIRQLAEVVFPQDDKQTEKFPSR